MCHSNWTQNCKTRINLLHRWFSKHTTTLNKERWLVAGNVYNASGQNSNCSSLPCSVCTNKLNLSITLAGVNEPLVTNWYFAYSVTLGQWPYLVTEFGDFFYKHFEFCEHVKKDLPIYTPSCNGTALSFSQSCVSGHLCSPAGHQKHCVHQLVTNSVCWLAWGWSACTELLRLGFCLLQLNVYCRIAQSKPVKWRWMCPHQSN